MSAAHIANANVLQISVPSGSTVLVNVTGTAGEFVNLGFDMPGVVAEDVIFTFCDATTLDIQGIGVPGSILAPDANISFNNAQVNGTLVGASLTGNGQANDVPFMGCIPAGTYPAPRLGSIEPQSTKWRQVWEQMLHGFSLGNNTGATRR